MTTNTPIATEDFNTCKGELTVRCDPDAFAVLIEHHYKLGTHKVYVDNDRAAELVQQILAATAEAVIAQSWSTNAGSGYHSAP